MDTSCRNRHLETSARIRELFYTAPFGQETVMTSETVRYVALVLLIVVIAIIFLRRKGKKKKVEDDF